MKQLFLFIFPLLAFLSARSQNTETVTPTGRSYKGPDSNNVYIFVQQNPEYLGGDNELEKFIRMNLHYPENELAKKIEGKVLLRFVIEPNGSVSNITVTHSVSPALDKEAIRIVKLLPKFIPGYWEGKPVRSYFNFAIIFKI